MHQNQNCTIFVYKNYLCAQCLLALLAKQHRALPQASVLRVKRQKTRPQQQGRSPGSNVKETENSKRRANTSLRRVNFDRIWQYPTFKKRKKRKSNNIGLQTPSCLFLKVGRSQLLALNSLGMTNTMLNNHNREKADSCSNRLFEKPSPVYFFTGKPAFTERIWKVTQASMIILSVHFCFESYTTCYHPKAFSGCEDPCQTHSFTFSK